MPKWQSVVLITYQNFCFSVPTLTLSFHFRSFSNKKYIIQQVFVINVHLLTSPCIRTHDLFLVHESPPLTTKPGLRPKYQIFWCNKCMATFKICYKIEIKRLNKENSLALLFANKGSQIFGHPSQLRYTRIGKTSVLSSFHRRAAYCLGPSNCVNMEDEITLQGDNGDCDTRMRDSQ